LQRTNSTAAAALIAAAALAGCTQGNSAIEPGFTSFPLNTLKVQFAVGTANIGTAVGQSLGLNTVVTFRQPNGQSGTLVNTPSVVGPAGFVVPASKQAGTDAGTSSITATPQTAPGAPTVKTTFGTRGAAYGYGFAPVNIGTGGAPVFNQYVLPGYADVAGGGAGFPLFAALVAGTATGPASDVNPFVGGPPAFPVTQNGTYPAGFLGFNEGFTDFVATPVTGSYTVNVLVPTAPGSSQKSQTFSATAALNVGLVLGNFTPPVVTLDAGGGASVTATLPSGVIEAFVNILDVEGSCHAPAGPQFFTLRFTSSGTQQLPDTLGATSGGTAPGMSICSKDDYVSYAAGFDYPAFGAAYPANTSQTPTLLSGSGQADVTTSYPTAAVAP